MKKIFFVTTALAIIAGSAFIAQAKNNGEGMHPGKHKGGMMNKMDGNADGAISKDEFMAHATKRFTETDVNNDGNITEEEMKNHRKAEKAKRKQHKAKMEEKQDKRFSEMDANGDGQISKEEMKNHKGPMKDKQEGAPE